VGYATPKGAATNSFQPRNQDAATKTDAKTNAEKYRVIHKSVKQFKISQQINYSTDHGFFILHRCSMCPPLVIRQTSMR